MNDTVKVGAGSPCVPGTPLRGQGTAIRVLGAEHVGQLEEERQIFRINAA